MRWPLRNQIFLPFAGLLTVSVVLVTVVSAWYAADNSREQKLQHMKSVAGALGDTSFPLSPDIADRIAAMIGGEVVVLDSGGTVTATTLPPESDLHRYVAELPREGSETISSTLRRQSGEFLVTTIRRTHAPRPETLFVLIPQEQFSALQRDSFLPPLLVALPTLAVALILAMLISRRVGHRIHRLRDMFQRLSHGDFRSISVQGRNDEVRDLLTSANELSARLNQLQQELLHSERLQLLGQLSGGLAHQLRNSITGARLAIQLHERNCQANDDDMMDTAIAQLRLTEEQVLAVLSLRPDAALETTDEVVSLKTLVQEVRTLLLPQCRHWKSSVSIEAESEPRNMSLVSAACLKGALLNLVLNAIEAAGTGGRVRIVVSTTERDGVVEILDSGPGFEMEPSRLSEAFLTTKPDGIGLGLTIAQHAVEQESGHLTISRSDNWTSVRIQIPQKQCASGREVTA